MNDTEDILSCSSNDNDNCEDTMLIVAIGNAECYDKRPPIMSNKIKGFFPCQDLNKIIIESIRKYSLDFYRRGYCTNYQGMTSIEIQMIMVTNELLWKRINEGPDERKA